MAAIPTKNETTSMSKRKNIEPRDEKYKDAIFTVPNLICFGRLFGSFALFGVALLGWPYWFVGLFLALSLSDWIDGKLARWLHQRSDFGARLDSAADAMLYAALIGGACITTDSDSKPDQLVLQKIPTENARSTN